MRNNSMTYVQKSKRGIKGVTQEILAHSKNLKLWLVISLLLASMGAILTIIGPNQLSKITDLISSSLKGDIDMAAIGRIGVILLIIYGLSGLFIYLEHFILSTVTLDFSKNLRDDLSQKINTVPMKYFSTTSYGDILSRMTNDVSILQQALANGMPSMVSASVQFVGCLIMMIITEWRLAIAVILVTILGFAFMVIAMKKSQKFFGARQKNLGTLNGYIEEMYSGHDVVRISRANRMVKEEFARLNDDLYEVDWKSQFLSGIMQPMMNVVGNLGYVLVCVLGVILVQQDIISFGIVVAFIMYVRLFTSPLSTIAQGMTQMQMAAAAGDHIFDLLHEEDLPADPKAPKVLTKPQGNVRFEHVKFSYPNNPDKIIIKDFSADIHAGQKVAIVGPTGAGKTTMVNLLMRFFEINSGNIYIDDISIHDMRRKDVHDLFSMVLQDSWIFEGTVRENLVYNKEGISEDELVKACKACGIYHFVETLPKGFDTVLDDSVNLSSGQKQLLTIARAMLQNNPMLILDEATSSVDTRTEAITQKAMDMLMKERTSFVIAHRLSTIKNADLILVLNEGDIIEQGTHQELLAKNGFYAQLYNSQFENVG
ncbi:MAG: ABC transporter ATP-binding protein/permease [Erysipelotrichaceae bacterium]|nr:ABC transporter ATP-binding protein/permease [Erysipelotrichaceae bacterium]MDY5252118.1 ABC transporter ATP-binding protein [Erysipelotrichaceae bacterium]